MPLVDCMLFNYGEAFFTIEQFLRIAQCISHQSSGVLFQCSVLFDVSAALRVVRWLRSSKLARTEGHPAILFGLSPCLRNDYRSSSEVGSRHSLRSDHITPPILSAMRFHALVSVLLLVNSASRLAQRLRSGALSVR